MTAPTIGKLYRATTTTATAQQVVIEVSAVERETSDGWVVYGYRAGRSAAKRVRRTAYPQQYVIQ